jgi:acylphosphatase
MTEICRRFLVHGLVQGVFFRNSTQKKATELCLTGWVRNLPEGGVELVACGPIENLKQLETWLWQGPPAANVEKVLAEDSALEEHVSFEIK